MYFYKILFLSVCIFILSPHALSARVVALQWLKNDPTENVTQYKIYPCRSYASAQALNADYAPVVTVSASRSSVCVTIPDNARYAFFTVTAVNAGGESDPSNIVYWLEGNIIGGSYDNTPWTSVRVDGVDLAAFGVRFGLTRNITPIDCSVDFAGMPDSTTLDRCDLDHNSRIDGRDLLILGVRFGSSIPP